MKKLFFVSLVTATTIANAGVGFFQYEKLTKEEQKRMTPDTSVECYWVPAFRDTQYITYNACKKSKGYVRRVLDWDTEYWTDYTKGWSKAEKDMNNLIDQ